MNYKFRTSIAIILVLILTLAACGRTDNIPSNTSNPDNLQSDVSSDVSSDVPSDVSSESDILNDSESNDISIGDLVMEDDLDYFEDYDESSEEKMSFNSAAVVYKDSATRQEKYVAEYLSASLDLNYNLDTIYSDATKDNAEIEILVGNTNRAESKTAMDIIKSNRSNNAADYIIMVKNGTIVINATSVYALQNAVNYFIDNFCQGFELEIPCDYYRFYKQSLKTTSGSIAGVDLKKYVIVTPVDKSYIYSREIDTLNQFICDTMGVILPVVEDTKAETKYEILVGNTSRSQSSYNLSDDKYVLKQDGSKIVANGGNDASIAAAVRELITLTKSSIKEKKEISVASGISISKTLTKQSDNYNMVWSDEFNGTQLDLNTWKRKVVVKASYGGVNSNQTDSEENSRVENGNLLLRGTKAANGDYNSAHLYTKELFDYGYIEIRAKLPKGHGVWPAFWMCGTGNPYPEIDIFEMFGIDNVIESAVHRWWTAIDGQGHSSDRNFLPGNKYVLEEGIFNDTYHTIGCERTSEKITFYVDGFKYNEVDISGENMDLFNMPVYVILGMPIGRTDIMSPDETTIFPVTFAIDYIRLYQIPGVGKLYN